MATPTTESSETLRPEHAKLRAWQARTQAAGEFMDWLGSEHGLELVHTTAGQACYTPIRDLLAEWAGIDLAALEGEKLDMLAELRRCATVDR